MKIRQLPGFFRQLQFRSFTSPIEINELERSVPTICGSRNPTLSSENPAIIGILLYFHEKYVTVLSTGKPLENLNLKASVDTAEVHGCLVDFSCSASGRSHILQILHPSVLGDAPKVRLKPEGATHLRPCVSRA